jgi:hypothetical protein
MVPCTNCGGRHPATFTWRKIERPWHGRIADDAQPPVWPIIRKPIAPAPEAEAIQIADTDRAARLAAIRVRGAATRPPATPWPGLGVTVRASATLTVPAGFRHRRKP